jgi:hypothetical protein
LTSRLLTAKNAAYAIHAFQDRLWRVLFVALAAGDPVWPTVVARTLGPAAESFSQILARRVQSFENPHSEFKNYRKGTYFLLW